MCICLHSGYSFLVLSLSTWLSHSNKKVVTLQVAYTNFHCIFIRGTLLSFHFYWLRSFMWLVSTLQALLLKSRICCLNKISKDKIIKVFKINTMIFYGIFKNNTRKKTFLLKFDKKHCHCITIAFIQLHFHFVLCWHLVFSCLIILLFGSMFCVMDAGLLPILKTLLDYQEYTVILFIFVSSLIHGQLFISKKFWSIISLKLLNTLS